MTQTAHPPTFDAARAELRAAELDLMLARERVAAARRDLPPGPVTDDYEFASPAGSVRLSELFVDDRPLVLYHFMYGKQQQSPCPMCAMWADAWNAVAHHVAENLDFHLVSAAPIDETLALADERGWTDLQWLSAHESTFKLDIGGENAEGGQWPFVSVWERGDDGPRLAYATSAQIEGDHWRGLDLLSPVWHLLDLTRPGRGDWMPST